MTGRREQPAERDVAIASRNWWCWRDAFEHVGPPHENPILTDDWRFRAFLREYGVARTIRSGQSDELRKKLANKRFPYAQLLRPSGSGVDHHQKLLSGLACKDQSSLVSLVSKIAAFLEPETFSAWDQFARKGARLSTEPKPAPFQNYAAYLVAVNDLLAGQVGAQVQAAIAQRRGALPTTKIEAFQRRVLDVYLMRVGGRKY